MSSPYKLNCFEKKAIEELEHRFKNRLPAHLEDDTLFYRFLKARNFDVNKAEIMLTKHIAWRKTLQVDKISSTFKPKKAYLNYTGSSFINLDKEGNIVKYLPSGTIDMTDFANSMKMNDYIRHWIWATENDLSFLAEENKLSGRHAYQISFIFDLDGYTFANATNKVTTDFVIRMTNLLQDNYPERLKSLYIINAPVFFAIIFSIIKKVMSAETIQKVQVFGSSGWKDALLKEIDSNVLPAFLGGTRTDPDGNPRCKTFVNQGGRIPQNLFLPPEERRFRNMERVRKILVLPGLNVEIPVDVPHDSTVIRWEFETKNKDIGFGLFYHQRDKSLKEILPIYNVVTTDGVETESYEAKVAGTYVVIFDNSHSWLNSKEVFYCITVENKHSHLP